MNADKKIGIVIADVVGKGVPSAILMSEARAALRAQVENIHHPDEIIERCESPISKGMWMTHSYVYRDTELLDSAPETPKKTLTE